MDLILIKYLTWFSTFLTIILILAQTVYFVCLWNVRPFRLFDRLLPEHFYLDPEKNLRYRFPNIHDDPTVTLSVVIPCFNEFHRMDLALNNCMEELEFRHWVQGNDFTFEVIIVNDGSSDETNKLALHFVQRYSCKRVRLLTLMKQRGKGGAIRMGMMSCRGQYILFMNADCSVRFQEIDKLFIAVGPLAYHTSHKYGREFWKCPLVVCGSRTHLETFLDGKSFLKRMAYKLFQSITSYLITEGTIEDTQCGFKLFTRYAARLVIPNVHVEDWAFDVELLAIIRRLNIPFGEIPIDWTETPGSKLTTLGVLKMIFDVFVIWIRYRYRKWVLSCPPVLPHFPPLPGEPGYYEL